VRKNNIKLKISGLKTFVFFPITILTVCVCFLKAPPLSAEVIQTNPLYKPLTISNDILETILNLNQNNKGFIPVSFRNSLEGRWPKTEENFFQDNGILAAEDNFNKYCARTSNLKNENTSNYSIPPVIHLIWLGSTPPSRVDLVIESWKRHHPSWKIKLWTDKDIENFSWTCPRSKNFYEKSGNWAEKSDILRFEILYQFGGIYSDTDVICLKSFEDLISSKITFFAGLESNKVKRFGRPLVGSAIIGAKKNSAIVKDCIDFSQTLEEAPTIRQYIRSGPGPITKASYKALKNINNENIIIFPCSYFYPMHWEARLSSAEDIIEYIRPESFAIHLWEGSWFDSFPPPQKKDKK